MSERLGWGSAPETDGAANIEGAIEPSRARKIHRYRATNRYTLTSRTVSGVPRVEMRLFFKESTH